MIDRAARDRAATLLRRFVGGRITNDDFDSDFPQSRTDPSLDAVSGASWRLYSDNFSHRLTGRHALTREERRQVLRWVLFLHSGLEYEWPEFNWYRVAWTPSPLIDWLLGGALTRRKKREAAEIAGFQAAGDFDLWPFIRETDLRRALRHPRLLGGRPPLAPLA